MDRLSNKIRFLQHVHGKKNLPQMIQEAKMDSERGKDWDEDAIRRSKNTIEKNINDYMNGKTKRVANKTARLWAKATGMPNNLFDIPLTKFTDELYKLKNEKQTPRPAYYLCREHGESELALYHKRFNGYHFGWFPWPTNEQKEKNYYKVLIKINDIVPMKKMIDVEMVTAKYVQQSDSFKKKKEWGYKGRLLPLVKPGGLCLFLEHINEDMGFFSAITIQIAQGAPKEGVWGIYTAEPAWNQNVGPVPCAARFFMKKINSEGQNFSPESLFDQIGWRSEEQFMKATGVKHSFENTNKSGILISTPDY